MHHPVALSAASAFGRDIARHANPGFPIASPVLVPRGAALVSVSGMLADVVKMNVFLVGDPRKGGGMDFEGLMQGCHLQVYGLRAPEKSLPARTTVQVAGLPFPGTLVEIEVVAARHAAH
jgi:enamine deaminase RidA (YjgF/YER057c/UK114 family)